MTVRDSATIFIVFQSKLTRYGDSIVRRFNGAILGSAFFRTSFIQICALKSHCACRLATFYALLFRLGDLLHSSTPLSFIQRTIIRAMAHHVQPRLEYCERTFASVVRANKAMPMHLGSKFGAKWRFFGWIHCLDTSEAQQSCRSLNYQWLHSTCWCSQCSKIGRIHKPGLPGSNPSHKDRQMLSAHLLPYISTRVRHLLFCLICR